MRCAKTDVRPSEDPAAGGGRVDLIAVILRWGPSIPNARDESGFEAKKAGIMVERRQREGERRKRKTRKSTDKNGVAKQGHTADEDKKISAWPQQSSYLACWSNRN